MKRRITIEFISVVLTAILIFIIGGFFIVKGNMNDLTELNLQNYVQMIIIEYETEANAEAIVDKYDRVEDYLRITFMAPNGNVIADSRAEDLENHLDRPEFNDIGTAYIRHSATLDIEMMYLAAELDDGNFVRVAIPTSSLMPFLNDFIGLSIIIGVGITIITIFISGALINKAMRPLKDVKSILREVNDGEYKEIIPVVKNNEINGLISEINDINRLIAINIASLKSEKEKNDFLLNNINQGVCVLDNEGRLILINDYLKRLYRFNIDVNLHKDYRFLFRDNEIQEAITKIYDKHIAMNIVTKLKESYFSISLTYLEKSWTEEPGVILIFTDITAIKNIENLKRDFFNNASHELKSPLTAIIGSSDLISQGMAKDENTILDLSKRISEEANRMNNLVMDMLALSKYEDQTQIIHREDVDLNAVLREVTKTLENQANQKNITIETSDRTCLMTTNYDQMFQLLKNLLENAIRYGVDGGAAKVNIQKENQNIVISVEDNGIGIPKADQARVFERFYRVDKAHSKLTGGTGLGLSIVKHIVMNYNGNIELDSAEGKGTKVTILIPDKQSNSRKQDS